LATAAEGLPPLMFPVGLAAVYLARLLLLRIVRAAVERDSQALQSR